MKSFARVALFMLPAGLAACTSTIIKDPPQPVVVPPLPVAVVAPPPPRAPVPPLRHIKVLPPHLDPASELYGKRSAFFDFDAWALKPEDRPVVEAYGIYLWRYPELRIRVVGNTDERGGREYNLALGQRRAEAVKAAMLLLGARDAQIEAVSLGEEKPRFSGSSESARAMNRRADILYRRSDR